MPHTCLPFRPAPIADSLSGPIAAPCATAVRLVWDSPPSNCTMLASMQCLAKSPSPRATNGEVWTTFGGATATPIVSLRSWPLQLVAACCGAAPAVKTCGVVFATAEGLACASAAAVAAGAAGAAVEAGGGAAGVHATHHASASKVASRAEVGRSRMKVTPPSFHSPVAAVHGAI